MAWVGGVDAALRGELELEAVVVAAAVIYE